MIKKENKKTEYNEYHWIPIMGSISIIFVMYLTTKLPVTSEWKILYQIILGLGLLHFAMNSYTTINTNGTNNIDNEFQ